MALVRMYLSSVAVFNNEIVYFNFVWRLSSFTMLFSQLKLSSVHSPHLTTFCLQSVLSSSCF